MTRFSIAKQIGADAYRTIWGACEGYPEHTGAILLEHYATPERVDALLDLGHIYYLGKNLDWPDGTTFEEKQANKDGTMAFTRDFGEENFNAKVLTFQELDDPKSWNDFIYIFTEGNQWAYFEHGMSEYGLLDLRDSVDRLVHAVPPKDASVPHTRQRTPCGPLYEDVYIYRNTKNQSTTEMFNSRNRIRTYMQSKGYENGGSISITRPMSKCGSQFQSMIQYCQQRGISKVIVENRKALGENSAAASKVLDTLCGMGFTVELAESGMVYTSAPAAGQTDTAVRDAIQNFMIFEEETSSIYPFAATHSELAEETILAIIAKCGGYTDTETVYAAIDSVVGINPVLGLAANETQDTVCGEMEEMHL